MRDPERIDDRTAAEARPLAFLRAEPRLRASDAEREAVAVELRRQAGAGTLDEDELEERQGAAYAAVHRADLTALLADLPLLPDARPPVAWAPPARAAAPGPLPERYRVPLAPAARRGGHGELVAETGVWLATSLVTIFIWAFAGAGYFWPIWVIGPWAIILGVRHAARALGFADEEDRGDPPAGLTRGDV
jgi:hypothetical protein